MRLSQSQAGEKIRLPGERRSPHVCTSPGTKGNVQLHGASYNLEETANGATNSSFSMRDGFGGRAPLEKKEKG